MNIPNFDQTPSALDYFAALVSSDEHFPLLEAAASIALIDEPELDVESVLEEVERMVDRVRSRMISSADDLTRLAVLNHVFYKDMGFGLNANDYYAPRNSFVNEVLRTRRGIPVSLSVIWLEMAQELGLRAHGIAFPGHFLVKVALDSGLVVLDPATGESLGIDHLSERLEPFRDQEDQLLKPDLDEGETPLGLYLQSCPPRDVLTRMLRNLKEIYQTQQDWPACLAVLDRILVLWPESWAERRDRGLVHAELGNAGQALSDLQAYLDAEPLAADQGALQARIKEIASPLSGSQ
ncbi:tetratricopeptide repeat protein [Limnohabitans sp.]|jgi:regulator of sirC expression with transglutaminase-like and TPR domain|uniref:SirB1 family protein n=1 Tax=Limnohabitans sp. TaxID=1907725 RepID=UPI00311E872C